MIQKLSQIGNSKGIILSKPLLDFLKITSDQTISVEADEQAQAIIITKTDTGKKKLTVSPHFSTLLEKVNKEYGPALKKLAEL